MPHNIFHRLSGQQGGLLNPAINPAQPDFNRIFPLTSNNGALPSLMKNFTPQTPKERSLIPPVNQGDVGIFKEAFEGIDLGIADEMIKRATDPQISADQFEKLLSAMALSQQFIKTPEAPQIQAGPAPALTPGKQIQPISPFRGLLG